MKVEYGSTECFCNYQVYGCLVFVFAGSCIYSRQYTLIIRSSQQTEPNVGFVTDARLGLRGKIESSLSLSFTIYVLLVFFSGGFIRTEAKVHFVTIIRVEYLPSRCFCNYQAYGCVVFYSVL